MSQGPSDSGLVLPSKLSRFDPNQTILARFLANGSTHQAKLTDLAAGACRYDVAALFLETCRQRAISLDHNAESLLEAQATQTGASNLKLLSIFLPLAQQLHNAGVHFLLLKGMALNLTLYPRLDLRPMTDIDVLIRPHDADRADGVLRSCGWAPGRALLRNDFYPRYHYEREYLFTRQKSIKIDVHVRPLRPLRYRQTVAEDALWDQTHRIFWADTALDCPSESDMLIHLAAHCAIHGNRRLLWLYDIHRLICVQGASLDWDAICDKVQRWGLALPVREALTTVSALFDNEEARRQAEVVPRRDTWQDRMVLNHAPRDCDHPVAHLIVDLLTTPGVRFKWGYLLAVLLPDRGHLQQIYRFRHRGWTFSAHLWRLVRVPLRLLVRPIAGIRRIFHVT